MAHEYDRDKACGDVGNASDAEGRRMTSALELLPGMCGVVAGVVASVCISSLWSTLSAEQQRVFALCTGTGTVGFLAFGVGWAVVAAVRAVARRRGRR